MKEFIRTLKENFVVNRVDLISYALYPAFGGIFGIIMVLFIMAVEGSGEDYGKIGALFAAMIGVILIMFGGIFSLQNDFNLAISMGKTRKYYVPARYLVLVADCLVCFSVVMLINWLEDILYTGLYPGAVCELDMVLLGNAGYMAGLILIIPVFILLFGVLFMKFSAKFFWILWAVWILVFSIGPQIPSAIKENPDSIPGKIGLAILQFCSHITTAQVLSVLVVAVLVCMVAVILLFRKQRVTA